jgi:L-rhamnose mutarotase
MSRAGFILHLRPDRVDEYVAAHANVCPELLDAIREAGIRDYSLFLTGRTVFGCLEADDIDEAFKRLGRNPVNARWQDAMASLLEERVADQGPEMVREIFRLD